MDQFCTKKEKPKWLENSAESEHQLMEITETFEGGWRAGEGGGWPRCLNYAIT